VLYEIAGRPFIEFTLDTLKAIEINEIVIVVGYQADQVLKTLGSEYKYALQEEQLGTGHAASLGLSQVPPGSEDVMVLYGDDTAFYRPETFKDLINFSRGGSRRKSGNPRREKNKRSK
jgi:bifunctional UDP-N-acetylglucosamine pyrophosphorylase/glucosamine-1-phosphate N-acetyltransferase